MDSIAKALLALHIVAGTAALVAGALPIFAPKRRGFHTRWGGRYVLCMWAVLGSAVGLTLISRNAYFAALTVSAVLGCFSGVRVLRRKRADQRAEPLDWIVTTTALAIASGIGVLQASGRVDGNPAVVYALLGGTFVVGGYDLMRFARPLGWPWFPGLWFYEHLVKMITSYAAVMSAFSGSIAFTFLPDPWKQLWATVVFQVLTLAMIAWYARQRRRAARPGA
jgi:uncharacterized membrane protein